MRRSSESFEEDTPLSPATPGFEGTPYEELAFSFPAKELSDKKIAQRIITRHAHHLLVSCQFTSLGEMSYFLKFDLEQFLEQEKHNLSEIVDPVHVFMCLHEEFAWPFPDIVPRILDHPHVSSNINFVSISSESESKTDIISLDARDNSERRDDESVYADSVYSDCRVEIDPNVLARALKRGTPESESQLTFFLDLFMKTKVQNYALLFALTLRDVDKIVDIIKNNPTSGMLSYLMAIDTWVSQESGGYYLFLQSLKPLLAPLFPTSVNDNKLKPIVRISSISSLNSLNSLDPNNPTAKRKNLAIPEGDEIATGISNLRVSPDVISTSSTSSCSVS